MIANNILLDAFTRVHESLHRTLGDITAEELVKEPHPSIGWLACRISRVMDANVSRLSGREQLCIGAGWASLIRACRPNRRIMGDRPDTHARASQLFHAPAQQLLDYHDTTHERMKIYLTSLFADELAREARQTAIRPAANGSCALGQRLGERHDQRGADQLFKAYHRLGGWFPREAKDPASVR